MQLTIVCRSTIEWDFSYMQRESVSHVCAVDEYGGDVLSLGN